MKQFVTIEIDTTLLEAMRSYYEPNMITAIGEYVDFQAKVKDIIITAFLCFMTNSVSIQNLQAATLWMPIRLTTLKRNIQA